MASNPVSKPAESDSAQSGDEPLESSIIAVDNMCCNGEAKLVHELLDNMEGIVKVDCSVFDRVAHIKHTSKVKVDDIVTILNRKYLGAYAKDSGKSSTDKDGWSLKRALQVFGPTMQILLFISAIAVQFASGNGGVDLLSPHTVVQWVAAVLYLCSIAMNYNLLRRALQSILRLRANAELLMTIALIGSLVLRDILEAATIGVIVLLMDVITRETYIWVERKLGGIDVQKRVVRLIDGTELSAAELKPGDVFLVHMGEQIPVDGVVVKDTAMVDESRLTGEALPQQKNVDDMVYSGSIVHSGFLQVKASENAANSFQGQIEDEVRQARIRQRTSRFQRIVDRVAQWYTPAVIVTAALVAILQRNVRQFLVIVVAGCPCALYGATPLVHTAAISQLSRKHKLLVKSGSALESLASMKVLGLDKTGTLTNGVFTVAEIVHIDQEYSKEDLHRWAATVETGDNHPLARAVTQSFTKCVASFAGTDGLAELKYFKREGRSGVHGMVERKHVGVGNDQFLETMSIDPPPEAEAAFNRFREQGAGLYVIVDDEVAAVMHLCDTLCDDAADTVRTLRESLNVLPVMLTGDNGIAAKRIADEVGINQTNVHHDLLPKDKAYWISVYTHGTIPADRDFQVAVQTAEPNNLQARDESTPLLTAAKERGEVCVGFIGDGLNDCPALASADCGIALQELGSAAVVNAADIALQGRLAELPPSILMSRRTLVLVKLNLILAFLLNVGWVVVAILETVPIWLSVLADGLIMLIVLFNSLWPLCW